MTMNESGPALASMFSNLGKALASLRARTGKSQTQIAAKAGIGKSQLSKYESGKELPKLESLERVLAALGVGYMLFFRVLEVTDQGEHSQPLPTRQAIDRHFTKLTEGLFILHRELVRELPDE